MEDEEFKALVRKQTSLNPSERYVAAMDTRQPIGGAANTDKLALFWIAAAIVFVTAIWLLG